MKMSGQLQAAAALPPVNRRLVGPRVGMDVFTPGVSWYSFLEAESTLGHMVPSVATEKFRVTPLGDPPTSSAVP
jgi:hypothetical protein